MVVFLSTRKFMVFAALCLNCWPWVELAAPMVRVKELFSTEAILPDTDCDCACGGGVCSWIAELRVVGSAQTAGTRMRLAKAEKTTRPSFLIAKPPQYFAGGLETAGKEPLTRFLAETPVSPFQHCTSGDQRGARAIIHMSTGTGNFSRTVSKCSTTGPRLPIPSRPPNLL